MLTATNLTTTGATTVFQATVESAVTCMIFCNYSVTDTDITVYAVPNTGSPNYAVGSQGNSNMILKTITITAGDTFVMDMEKLVLSTNDTIIAQASAANCISCNVSTMSIT